MKRALRLLLVAAAGLACLWAQKSGATGGTTGTTTGGTSTTGGATGTGTTTGTSPNPPIAGPTTSAPTPQTAAPPRPIYLSGTVITDDGSALPGSVDIQSVCANRKRVVAHTAVNGDFGFEWAENTGLVFEDASENGRVPGSTSGSGSGSGSSGTASSGGSGSRLTDPLADCDLRVDLPGYSSTRVSLYNHSQFDSFDVGSIVLHRIRGDEGHVVSVLSLKAPKDAKKNFDKGTELARAGKPADAAASFQKAVTAYPQYADAWLGLGMAELKTGDHDSARADFQKAMDLDDKLVGPWQQLGYMASDQSRWEDAARYLDQAVKLDPMDSSMAWYFSAMANYNLGHFDLAERSIRAEMKLDGGKNPRAEYLLGLVLIARKDMAGGADALRTYIASSPNAPEAQTAKQQLSRAESQLGR